MRIPSVRYFGFCHDDSMKANPESVNGPETMARLAGVLRKVLSVSHDEIMRREAEYKRQAALNPNRRGPKPKAKG